MNEVRLKARAKINISLDVIRKREDGYHDLSMIMQTVNLFDKVNMRKTKQPGIRIKTNLPFLPVDERNLVYKVLAYMMETYSIECGIFVDLFKVIPIAAGLAGGSADAAAAIKGMNTLFDLSLSQQEMCAIGKRFGADIPYCLTEGTVLAEGIGDVMTLLADFPPCHVVIAKPNVSVSTAFVYGNLRVDAIERHPNTGRIIQAVEEGDLPTICENLENVLEQVTVKAYPEIQKLKGDLVNLGAMGALMSGSGSAVFALFDTKESAQRAADHIKKQQDVKFAYATTVYNRRRD